MRIDAIDIGYNPPEDIVQYIKSIYLEDNQMAGTLSDALFVSWPDLQEIDLSNNQLHGNIPPELGSLSSVEIIELNNNQFIPIELLNALLK